MSIDVKGNVQNRRKDYESGKYFLVIYTSYMCKYYESNKDITHFLIKKLILFGQALGCLS